MPKVKTQPVIKLNIKPGPATPAQKTTWQKFWQRTIAEAKSEARK